jgi:peroxiredoxin
LADFQKHVTAFEKLDVRLLAASVDSLEDARKTITDDQLTYPIAYGLKAKEISRMTGAFYQAEQGFLHATGILFNRDGTIIVAAYSTGAIGRLSAEDCLKLIEYLQKQ